MPSEAVAAYWDKQTKGARLPRIRWWESPTILRHINRIVCGKPLPGLSAGLHSLLQRSRPEGYKRAVSVGCGGGYKEASLVRAGIVQEFHLYEISTERVRQGIEFAKSKGIADQMHFHTEDAFASCDGAFDLVYWNNALHHMMDTPAAISWSRDGLTPNGVFAMDDFVGPSRFQWTDYSLEVASRFRASLSPRHLGTHSPKVGRPSVEKLISVDPSEAADSERIIPALRATFPNVKIVPTGGVIYQLGLNNVLANIDEDDDDDSGLLSMALLLDEILARNGETQYAAAVALAE